MDNRLTLPRMWGIKEVISMLKEQDPNTGVTEHHIRQLCLNGKLKFERTGAGKNAKYLINVDSLIEYFSNLSYNKELPENKSFPHGEVKR